MKFAKEMFYRYKVNFKTIMLLKFAYF